MSTQKHYTLTADGLMAMARIFVSCRPIMGDILTFNQAFLIKQALAKKDVALSDFKRGLKAEDDTYDKIADFADGLGTHRITEDVVYRFFGGQPHFQKILGQIKERRLKRPFADQIFVAHILLPVLITGAHKREEGLVSALYQNGDFELSLRSLVPASGVEVRPGTMALAHYATVIDAHPDPVLIQDLLRIQAEETEFLSACRRTVYIDYLNFWNLSRWTKDHRKSCQF